MQCYNNNAMGLCMYAYKIFNSASNTTTNNIHAPILSKVVLNTLVLSFLSMHCIFTKILLC